MTTYSQIVKEMVRNEFLAFWLNQSLATYENMSLT